jgi:peptidyl-prolyl cis-trans isomerase SurA
MKHIYSTVLLFAIVFTAGLAVSAQETQERVVDEVIAQVNEGVITLSRIKRESKAIVDGAVKEGKSKEEAQKMVDEKQGELIANLVNEELLVQKAKELGIDTQADASVNERFVQMMKQHGMKSVDELHKAMEATGVDPVEIRDMWRKQAIKDMVIQREVHSKEYWRPSAKELREYYEKNKARFTKPETVSFSEIFLGFAGRDENAVREKAKQVVAQLRGGADFAKLAAENSDPGVVTQGTGKAEKVKPSDFSDLIANAIKGRKAGEVTDPIEANEVGVVILKIDAREAASSESFFDENAVRMAMLAERAPAATKDFMSTLRKDAYIKIGEPYRPAVSPILFAEERKEKVAVKADEKKEKIPAKAEERKEKTPQK